ncbi:acylphosphatase [Thalassobius sp. MITS945101]|uniref:acylphosphatase n=1 Tax=Thalassobius sp. MITS945101 TaxID=3096994 RepID=UPI00399B6B20
MAQTAVKARITGKVQGVAFRNWTRARATRHALQGYVINEPFGSVRAVFEGEARAVQMMLDELWEGPAAAVVQHVETEEIDLEEMPDEFRILH